LKGKKYRSHFALFAISVFMCSFLLSGLKGKNLVMAATERANDSNEYYTTYHRIDTVNQFQYTEDDVVFTVDELTSILGLSSDSDISTIQNAISQMPTNLQDEIITRSNLQVMDIGSSLTMDRSAMSINFSSVSASEVNSYNVLKLSANVVMSPTVSSLDTRFPIYVYTLIPIPTVADTPKEKVEEKQQVKTIYDIQNQIVYQEEAVQSSNSAVANEDTLASEMSLKVVKAAKDNIRKHVVQYDKVIDNIKFVYLKGVEKDRSIGFNLSFHYIFAHSYVVTTGIGGLFFIYGLILVNSLLYVIFWYKKKEKMNILEVLDNIRGGVRVE
jgi:hypothetical protein